MNWCNKEKARLDSWEDELINWRARILDAHLDGPPGMSLGKLKNEYSSFMDRLGTFCAKLILARDTIPKLGEKLEALQNKVCQAPPLLNKLRTPKKGEARVHHFRGELYKKIGNKWVEHVADEPLSPGDEVKTGPNGYFLIEFDANAYIRLDANTSFKLAPPKEEGEVSLYKFIRGKLYWVIHCLGGIICGNRHRIGTPNGSFAPLGTEFLLETISRDATQLTVLKGIVEALGAAEDKIVEVPEGHYLLIDRNGVTGKTVPIQFSNLERWWEEF